MAETLHLPTSKDRATIYASIIPQIGAVISGEEDLVANLANTAAILKEAFNFLWVGFYLVKGNELVLGPFQGPLACTRIALNKGVCGKAYRTNQTVIVPNVNEFPDHIACSSHSQSEIVVPIRNSKDEVIGVLDIDSEKLSDFSETDSSCLELITQLLEETLK